jgi:hypothetical protein
MKICPNCGIELETGYDHCPLCHIDINTSQDSKIKAATPYPGQDQPLSPREKYHLLWELSGILHFSGIVMTLLIDIILHKHPGWSLIVLSCITASYIYITLLVFATRHLLLFLGGLLLNTLGLLFFLDLQHNGIDWFFMLGLPLGGFFVIMLGAVLLFIRLTRQHGFNVIAAISLAIGIYIMIIETSVSMHLHGQIKLSWSVIVASSILPFALFLLYFHYRLKRGTSLRKFFHI